MTLRQMLRRKLLDAGRDAPEISASLCVFAYTWPCCTLLLSAKPVTAPDTGLVPSSPRRVPGQMCLWREAHLLLLFGALHLCCTVPQ